MTLMDMGRRVAFAALTSALGVVCAASGCAEGDRSYHDEAVASATGTGGAASSSSATGAGGAAGNAGIGGGTPFMAGCSGDLHGVLDKDVHVVATCADDQGCADGVCVPACEAAAKSHGNLGCDFVIATPSSPIGWETPTAPPPCFAV